MHRGLRRAMVIAVLSFAFVFSLAGSAFGAQGSGGSSGTSAQAASAKSAETSLTINASSTSTKRYATPLKPGVYYIQSTLSGQMVLDVAGGSKANGANVQIYTSNSTDAQRWYLTYDKQGLYTIRCMATGKYLDLANGTVANSQNIWQYAKNGTVAQKWIIAANGSGYTIASAKNRNYVLDVAGGSASNQTNVQLYRKNGTAAQRWWLIPEKNEVKSERILKNGMYRISFAASSNSVLEVSGGSHAAGANIQMFKWNGTAAQKWMITWNKGGYYTITNAGSGLPLAISSGGYAYRSNIWQAKSSSSGMQRWAITQNADKSYTFINMQTGTALSSAAAKPVNGTNVRTAKATRSSAQRFTVKAIPLVSNKKVYVLTPCSNKQQAVGVPSASQKAGTQFKTAAANGMLSQKFMAYRQSDGSFAFQSVASGLYLTDAKGKATQTAWKGAANQRWKVSLKGNGVVLENVSTGKALCVGNGTANSGSGIYTAAYTGLSTQRFKLAEVELIGKGYYMFMSSADVSKVLDVANGASQNGANIQVYTRNGSGAQVFYVVPLGSGWYRITSAATGRALEVAGGSSKAGANVQTFARNGTKAQRWKITMDQNGAFTLTNGVSGKTLAVAKTRPANGTNVQVANAKDTPAQRFKMKQTSAAFAVNLGVPCYYQNPQLPTGCESVALTNALRFYGFSLGKTVIADSYLTWSSTDFVYSFMGNPYTDYGAAVMAPGLTRAANRYLSARGSSLTAHDITGTSFDSLYGYLKEGTPVILWSTMYFRGVGNAIGWSSGYTMYSNTHTVVLMGYNASYSKVLVADSLDGVVWRDASGFRSIYNQMGKQAIVIY